MPPVLRQLPFITPREEGLLHAAWLLGCLEPGFVLELDERRFCVLFGSDAGSLRVADDLARRLGCQFAYRLDDRVAAFCRVEATGYAAEL